MNTELKEQFESLERQEAFYNDYWMALNNNTAEEREYNKKIKDGIDIKRAELNKLKEEYEARN